MSSCRSDCPSAYDELCKEFFPVQGVSSVLGYLLSPQQRTSTGPRGCERNGSDALCCVCALEDTHHAP